MMTRYVVLALTIASILLVPAVPQEEGDRCAKQMQKIPVSGDCDSYLMCIITRTWRRFFCPAGREFSPQHTDCVSRKVSTCQKKCDALPLETSGSWDSPSCTSGPSNLGATCSMTCNANFELRGSSVIKCTEFGWNSTNGNLIPKCVDVQCYSEIMQDTLISALIPCAGMLFVIDESGSIGAQDFLKSKEFVKDVVEGLPLNPSQTGGVITFDSVPRDRIPLTESNTKSFQRQVDYINYNSGGTDVLEALERALTIVKSYSSSTNKCYVVILITDGNSETEATPAADAIKNLDHPLFSIAVGSPNSLSYVESLSSKGKNGVRHFFYSRNFDILAEIGKYFKTPKPPTTVTKCA